MKYIKTFEKLEYKNLNEELIECVRRKDVDAIKRTLEKGADINYQNSVGNTALHVCTLYTDYDVLECLVTNNCDINIQNRNGETALIRLSKNILSEELSNVVFDMMLKLINVNTDWNIEDKSKKDFLGYDN